MDKLDRSALRELLERIDGPFASIYMPTHRTGADGRQDPIRLKNLIRRVEEQLLAGGLRRDDAEAVLQPARDLLAAADFWQRRCDGLAVFAAAGFFRRYCLPRAFEEIVVVAERPYVKPLLPLFSESGQFCVLALSQNDVRLLVCTRHSAAELPLEGVPRSLAEALGTAVPEKAAQFRALPPARTGQSGVVFHSHGDISDDAVRKKNLDEFLHQVCKGLTRLLQESRRPLVVAGTNYIRAQFRAICPYPHLVVEGVGGSPERLTAAELRDLAWPVVEPRLRQAEREAAARCQQAAGTPRASVRLAEIVPAAHQGRVDTLLVLASGHGWGRYDPRAGAVEVHAERQAGDQDLLDLAAVHTMLHHGRVFAVAAEAVPGGGPAAALLRVPASAIAAASPSAIVSP